MEEPLFETKSMIFTENECSEVRIDAKQGDFAFPISDGIQNRCNSDPTGSQLNELLAFNRSHTNRRVYFGVTKCQQLAQNRLRVFIYGLKPEVWGRIVTDPRAELRPSGWVDLYFLSKIQEILHFVLHHLNRRTVIHLTHHIMPNRDIIHIQTYIICTFLSHLH